MKDQTTREHAFEETAWRVLRGHPIAKAASVISVVDIEALQDAFCIDPYPILHLLYQLRPTGFIQPY